ncbi:MAG: phage integrase family protein [Phycisphaerales bacterium]|nr:phage integrase family protein [Phycisphaerales bacterium]
MGKRYPIEVLTKDEVHALLDACGKETWTDRRNYALLVLLWRTGLRISEALALRPCDVDLKRGAIRVLRGKGGRARTVGIDRIGLEVLEGWMQEHRGMGYSSGQVLFITRSGLPLSQGYLRRRIPELARAAGIHKRVHAHGIRHTHASELRAEGVDIAVIKQQLGHRSLMTTICYLDHLQPESVVGVMSSRGCC